MKRNSVLLQGVFKVVHVDANELKVFSKTADINMRSEGQHIPCDKGMRSQRTVVVEPRASVKRLKRPDECGLVVVWVQTDQARDVCEGDLVDVEDVEDVLQLRCEGVLVFWVPPKHQEHPSPSNVHGDARCDQSVLPPELECNETHNAWMCSTHDVESTSSRSIQ